MPSARLVSLAVFISAAVAGVHALSGAVPVGLEVSDLQATGPGGSSLETLNYVRFSVATDPNGFYVCQNRDGTPCEGSVVAPGTNWTVNYFSTSAAGFGVLRGKATISLSGDNSLGPFPTFVSVGGRGGFRDTLTVTGGSGTGTLHFLFQVTGTAGFTPGANGRPQFQWVPVVNGVPNFGAQLNYPVSPGGTAIVSFPFTFDTPTSFGIYFYALAQVFNWLPGASAFADYDSTAILVQIAVQDVTGEILPTVDIQSASGTAYTLNGVVQQVSVDVKPGEGVATINMRSNGVTAVGILSSPEFHAALVIDLATLTFGRTGLEHSVERCESPDLNGDGLADLLCHARTDLAGFRPGDTTARLQGFTTAGAPIAGVDDVRVVW